MSEPDSTLMLEILKGLRSDMSEMKADMGDLRLRMTATEDHLATLVMSVTGVNHRLDRLNDRVERIERRLDLTESK